MHSVGIGLVISVTLSFVEGCVVCPGLSVVP